MIGVGIEIIGIGTGTGMGIDKWKARTSVYTEDSTSNTGFITDIGQDY